MLRFAKLCEMNVGIIDLGTNSARLFIYRLKPPFSSSSDAQKIYRKKLMVRLGDGLFEDRVLKPEVSARTIRAFHNFSEKIDLYQPELLRAVATSALREARNGKKVAKQIEKETGIRLEIISGDEEARLIGKGVTSQLFLPDAPHVLIDIGGGSTEISVCRGTEILHSKSLRLGAARGQQNFLRAIPPADTSKLRKRIRRLLEKYFKQVNPKKIEGGIGSSGSIRALGKLLSGSSGDQKVIVRKSLSTSVKKMKSMDRKALLKLLENTDLEPARVDLLLSAAILLEEIMLYFDLKSLQATSYALKDGLLAEMLEQRDF